MIKRLRTGSVFWLTLAVFAIVPFSNSAQAVFKVNEKRHEPKPFSMAALSPDTPVIVELGKGASILSASKGNELPVDLAMVMILPDNWSIGENSSSSVLSKKVSWVSRGEPWKKTLYNLGARNQIRFLINWNKKLVTALPLNAIVKPDPNRIVTKNKPTKSIKTAKTDLQKTRGLDLKNTVANKPSVKKAAPSKKIVVWKLKPGSLRKQLETWCKANNKTLIWNSSTRDYLIAASATFTNEFNYTVYDAIMAIRSTSDCIFWPQFYTKNNVVTIVDR